MPLALMAPDAYSMQNRDLIVVLIVLFVLLVVIAVALTVVGAQFSKRANQRLVAQYEQLRSDTLGEFLRAQKAENARLLAETRAIGAQMSALVRDLKDMRDA